MIKEFDRAGFPLRRFYFIGDHLYAIIMAFLLAMAFLIPLHAI